MATRKRPGAARRTVTGQEAARKAKRAEAARTAGRKKSPSTRKKAGPGRSAPRSARRTAEVEAAFRAAEEDAALRGAEVEPAEPAAPIRFGDPGVNPGEALLPAHERPARLPGETTGEPSVDVSETRGTGAIGEAQPPLGWALADLARSALGLARTVVGVPFRLALAIPRIALRAVRERVAIA